MYYYGALDYCDRPAVARAMVDKGKSMLLAQAAAGNLDAMHELAMESRDSLCDAVPADLPAFFKWAETAANRGHVPSMTLLYSWYFSPTHNASKAESDAAQAKGVAWMLKAAEAGDVHSQAAIGYRYLHGNNLPQDRDKAMQWLSKASDQGDAAAKRNLALIHADGTGMAIRNRAVPLLIEAAEAGDTDAPMDLASIYYEGTVIPQNYAEARSWARKPAENHITAQLMLAMLYLQGQGGDKDLAEAYAWASVAKAGSNQEMATTIMDLVEKEGGSAAVEAGQSKATTYAKSVHTIF